MQPAIKVERLTKRYGEVTAVDGIDLEIPHGQVVAILGPNGAGKTTTLEMIVGFRTPTSGSVAVLGHDATGRPREMLDQIGVVFQQSGLEDDLTVEEAIRFHGMAYSQPRVPDDVCETVGLSDAGATRIRVLSGGQRRRLDLALALVGDPQLLFLDEPTTGFDPAARRATWTAIEMMAKSGTTVVLTTHYLDEAQNLADRLIVINRGAVAYDGTPRDLVGDTPLTQIRFEVDPTQAADLELGPSEMGHFAVTTDDPVATLAKLTSRSIDMGVELRRLTVSPMSLEDAYLALIDGADH